MNGNVGPMFADSQAHASEPIDVVYLWVDGAAPGFAESLAHAREKRGARGVDAAACRYRNNGELRFSLRSLMMHAPWVGRVHIVTNGQAPDWLNTNHPRLSLVTHAQIFPDPSVLPCFNSVAIEWNLHRIPHLSTRFLYLNDDFFLGRPVVPEMFIRARGGQRVFFEYNPVYPASRASSAHDRSCALTVDLVRRRSGPRPDTHPAAYHWTWKRKLLGFRPLCRLPAHVPQLYNRRFLEDVEAAYAKEVTATRKSSIRSPSDIMLRVAYYFHLLETSPYDSQLETIVLDWNSPEFAFIAVEEPAARVCERLRNLKKSPARFFCLNDDLGDTPADHPCLVAMHDTLRHLFPEPSCFERA